MSKEFLISLASHLALVVLFWLGSALSSKPPLEGYPMPMNAIMIQKSDLQKSNRSKRVKKKHKRTAVRKKRVIKKKRQASSKASGKSNLPKNNALSVDAKHFPFPEYLSLIQYRVEMQWNPPVTAISSQTSKIYFKIDKTGKLLEATLKQASGNFAFDQAALRAVYNAAPFPPLPQNSKLFSLGVHFEFVGHR